MVEAIQMVKIRTYIDFMLYAVGLTLFNVITICVINDEIREGLHKKLTSHQREVLSTATGNILYNGQKTKVIKVRKNNEFFLEIYANTNAGVATNEHQKSLSLVSRIPLAFGKDAYINFKGVSSNLALYDVDGDNKLEILVPGYEKNLSAKLSIYKYDEKKHIFRLANANLLAPQIQ